MKSLLKALCERLRVRRDNVTKVIEVRGIFYDPTYGPSSITETITIIDFDKLLQEIDEFAKEFAEKPEPRKQP